MFVSGNRPRIFPLQLTTRVTTTQVDTTRDTVHREGVHLLGTTGRLFSVTIDAYSQERFGAQATSWPPMLPTSPTASPGDV